jgi:tape measure domain-containing protein
MGGAGNLLRGGLSGGGMSAVGVGVGAAAGYSAVRFGSSVLESLKNYEFFSASLRTLLKGDVGAAKRLEAQLVSFAANTPFGLLEIQGATKRLLAYGFASSEITPALQKLGDVSSALKISLGDVAYLYGTTKTQGRVYARDILQLTNRGIPVLGTLAEMFNTNTQEITKMVTAGSIGFAEISKAFDIMTQEGGVFYKMMDTQAKTAGGRIEKLGDEWEQLKVNIGKSQTGIIATTTAMFTKMTVVMKDYFIRRNKLDETFAKHGVQVAPAATEAQHIEKRGVAGRSVFWTKYAEGMSKNLKMAKTAQLAVGLSLIKLTKLRDTGVITEGHYKQERAIRLEARSTLKSVIDSFRLAAGGKIDPITGQPIDGSNTNTSKVSGGATSVEARKPQNFYITIGSLVEQMEIIQNSTAETAAEMKEVVVRTFVEALNDVQLIAAK